MSVLVALSVTNLLNDMIQSLIPAIYPIIWSCPRFWSGRYAIFRAG